MTTTETVQDAIRQALTRGRQACDVLEAGPADESHGYDQDEVAGQYAACDRLVEVFRTLDRLLSKPVDRTYAECDTCGEEVVFDAWVYADGSVHAMYDENLCLGCDGPVHGFTEKTGRPER